MKSKGNPQFLDQFHFECRSQKERSKRFVLFLCLCPWGHNNVLQRRCKHHLTDRSTSLYACGHKKRLSSGCRFIVGVNS
ncbi:MAG: hypothetical protein Q4B04_03855 [bacterium]|nr:hypothetical protein [bacterium]